MTYFQHQARRGQIAKKALRKNRTECDRRTRLKRPCVHVTSLWTGSVIHYHFNVGFFMTPFPPMDFHVESILNRNNRRVNSYTTQVWYTPTMAAAGVLLTHWPGYSQTKLGLPSSWYGWCVLRVALSNFMRSAFCSTSYLEVAFDPFVLSHFIHSYKGLLVP